MPEAYRILYETFGAEEKSPESGKVLAKVLELIEGGAQAMAKYFQEDDFKKFEATWFEGCPLPTKEGLGL